MDHTDGQPRTSAALAWFPLVCRPRPPAPPLQDRLRHLQELLAQPGEDHSRLARAAEACNKGALIASDCGLPDLARTLCWRQHDVFDQARPLPAWAAKLAIQPVLNLPRQLIRDGDAEGAYAILDALHRGARDRSDVVIDERTVHLRDLVRTAEDHNAIRVLVWAALLADGTRALLRAGRWRQAAEHAAAHRGVGNRLFDGRQVTILALAHDGQPRRAAEMLEQSTPVEPWEQTVQTLLRVCCHRLAGADPSEHIEAMLAAVNSLLDESDPTTAVFRTRVGLVALDLNDHADPHVPRLCAKLVATAESDANAARDALAHPHLCQEMTADQHRALTRLTHTAGLASETIPDGAHASLMTTMSLAGDQLRVLLDHGFEHARH